MLAAEFSNDLCLSALIDSGADVSLKDRQGKDATEHALDCGRRCNADLIEHARARRLREELSTIVVANVLPRSISTPRRSQAL